MVEIMLNKQSIKIREWVKRGIVFVNTSALDIDDPDHIYNQALAQGVEPEEFGIENPLAEEFKDWTVAQLQKEVIELRKEINSLHKFLAMVG